MKYSESLKISRDKLSPRSILKPENTDFTYDEGISSNDSSSDSETGLRKSKASSEDDVTLSGLRSDGTLFSDRFAHVNIEKSSPKSSSVSCSDTHTSDESSGGREIRSIIAGEAAAKRRQQREK